MPFDKGPDSIVFVDLETGGVEPRHPDIEIAAIAVDPTLRLEIATFHARIRFDEAKADPEALAMNGYDRALWKDAEDPESVFAAFNRFCGRFACVERLSRRKEPYYLARLAGHNVQSFDLPRLGAWADRCGEFPSWDRYFALDTMQRALWHVAQGAPQPANWKLPTLTAAWLPGETFDHHQALEDVRACIALARLYLGAR